MITCVFVVNGGKCVYNIDIRDRNPNNLMFKKKFKKISQNAQSLRLGVILAVS